MCDENCKCRIGPKEKFIQPCILLLLMKEKSYGYILIEKLKEFGFYEDTPDAGVIYRNLNKLEKEVFVESQWVTDEPGPAKRIYNITERGRDHLKSYVEFFGERKRLFDKFIEIYEGTK